MMQPDEKKLKERRELSVEKPATLDREIDDVETALINSRAFLEGLEKENDELHRRAEEIAFSYERELDRLRSKKNP